MEQSQKRMSESQEYLNIKHEQREEREAKEY